MTFLRGTIIVGVLFYIGLWVLALNGANSLIPILAVPLVLAVMVAAGTLLSSYIGLPSRPQKFESPNDEKK